MRQSLQYKVDGRGTMITDGSVGTVKRGSRSKYNDNEGPYWRKRVNRKRVRGGGPLTKPGREWDGSGRDVVT